MSLFEVDAAHVARQTRAPISNPMLDLTLTAQLVVAWAGEGGEEKRLGWWRSDLVSEFGGEDLFKRLMPSTWRWAVLQGAREAARRHDAQLRGKDHDADRLVSLFSLGFEIDERLDERLRDLKLQNPSPAESLPGLAIMADGWSVDLFAQWVAEQGASATTASPTGRRLKGAPPSDLDALVKQLISGLAPLSDSYPLPHFRRDA